MSDLSVPHGSLQRSRSQLSVSSYFDTRVFEREQTHIFQPGPRYVGHELSVPEVEVDSVSPRFVDAGMDDEMIETSSFEVPPRNGEVAPDSYQPSATQHTEQEPEFEKRGEGLVQAEAENFEAGYAAEPTPVAGAYGEPTSEFQYRETEEAPMSEPEPPRVSAEQAAPTTPDGTGIGAAVASATADAFSEFDEFSRTEQIPAFGGPSATSDTLDEMDLLELPPIENGNTLELTKQSGSFEPQGEQLVSLSPELMEIIVQKVVDKLSDKN
jgi:hypothetical protein